MKVIETDTPIAVNMKTELIESNNKKLSTSWRVLRSYQRKRYTNLQSSRCMYYFTQNSNSEFQSRPICGNMNCAQNRVLAKEYNFQPIWVNPSC